MFGFSDLRDDIAAQLIRAGVQVTVFNQRSVAQIVEMLRQVAAIVDARRRRARRCCCRCRSAWRRCGKRFSASGSGQTAPACAEEWDEPGVSGIQWVSELIPAGKEDIYPELARQPLG